MTKMGSEILKAGLKVLGGIGLTLFGIKMVGDGGCKYGYWRGASAAIQAGEELDYFNEEYYEKKEEALKE